MEDKPILSPDAEIIEVFEMKMEPNEDQSFSMETDSLHVEENFQNPFKKTSNLGGRISIKKRKRVVLSIQQKLEIINSLENGKSVKFLASEYNVGEQTVREMMKKKTDLMKYTSSAEFSTGLRNRKTMKKATYESLDKAMLNWFVQQRALGNPTTGAICAEKAKYFFQTLGMEGKFDASSGWLYRFKKRHGLQELDSQGTLSSRDKDPADNLQDIDDSDELSRFSAAELASMAVEVQIGEEGDEKIIHSSIECNSDMSSTETKLDEDIVRRVTVLDAQSERKEEWRERRSADAVTHGTALVWIEGLLDYLEEQDDALVSDKLVLRKLQSKIKKKL